MLIVCLPNLAIPGLHASVSQFVFFYPTRQIGNNFCHGAGRVSLLKDTLRMDAVMPDYSGVPLLMDGGPFWFFFLNFFLSSVLSLAAWLHQP